MQQPATKRNFVPLVILLTLVINLLVALLFFAPPVQVDSGFDWTLLPFLNAIFNSFTFMLLLGAWISIRRGNRVNHRRFVGGAMTTTTLFLISYVTYHAVSESTKFGGEGFVRPIYFFILITHIILAAVIVPLVLMSLAHAVNQNFEKHKKWTRFTMPLWLYVSFTGVIVYIMIRPYY